MVAQQSVQHVLQAWQRNIDASSDVLQLLNPDLGRVTMKYRRVECTPPKDLTVEVTDYRVGGWIRVNVQVGSSKAHAPSCFLSVSASASASASAVPSTEQT